MLYLLNSLNRYRLMCFNVWLLENDPNMKYVLDGVGIALMEECALKFHVG